MIKAKKILGMIIVTNNDSTNFMNICNSHFIQKEASSVISIAFSPNDELLVSGSGWQESSHVDLWDVETGNHLIKLGSHARGVSKVLFDFTGNYVFSGSYDGQIKLWEVATGKELLAVAEHNAAITDLILDNDRNQLISCDINGNLIVWNLSDMKMQNVVKGHQSKINCLAISRGRELLASSDSQGIIKLWSLKSLDELFLSREHNESVNAIAFDISGEIFFSADFSSIAKWIPGKETLVLAEKSYSEAISSFAFRSTDDIFAVGYASDDIPIRLFSSKNDQLQQNVSGSSDNINDVQFSFNGIKLACASAGKSVGIEIWDLDLKS